MKEYLLGIDLGTSGTKTVLFRSDGPAMAAHTVEYPLYQLQNGWAEQEPSDWWRAVRETVQAVLHKSGVAAADIAGVGISGQMHGLVMLDERGEVLHRSILWCDGRTGEECREITETVGAEKLIAITANPALAGFTAGKILWVRKHLPEVYKACRHILLPKDYIRYCLTGQFATEVSDASGMNLLDVPRRQWSDEILNKLDIDPALLGRMYESVDVTGTVTAEAAALTGRGYARVGRRGRQRRRGCGHRYCSLRKGLYDAGHLRRGLCPCGQRFHRPGGPRTHLLLRRSRQVGGNELHAGGGSVPALAAGYLLCRRGGRGGQTGRGPL